MRQPIWIVVMMVLGGCAPMQFENAGSPNTLAQDQYDCEVQLGYRGGTYSPEPTDQLMDDLARGHSETQACLERKGWKRTDGEVQAKKPDADTGQHQPRGQTATTAPPSSAPGGSLGIVPAEVTPTIANLLKMDEVGGVFVAAVYAGSVASRAGIKKGDVILKYGDKVLSTDPEELRAAMAATPPGSTVAITIWRNSSEVILSAQY